MTDRYRHIQHVGDHGDALKHTVLAHLLTRFRAEHQQLYFIDSHAASGVYSIAAAQDWPSGIGKLWSSAFCEHPLLAPWKNTVLRCNQHHTPLQCYPGSPALAFLLLRAQDQLYFGDLHASELNQLKHCIKELENSFFTPNSAPNVHFYQGDCHTWLPNIAQQWQGKPGLLLMDPPYEQETDYEKVALTLNSIHHQWPEGSLILWYPHYKEDLSFKLFNTIKQVIPTPCWQMDLVVRKPFPNDRLVGCGLLFINVPPAVLSEIQPILDGLVSLFMEYSGHCFFGPLQ
ncbi:23S rRNA (adenine(2030)-N(6))-methyltransferase RlmJ [Zooshikella sp. RANM57]|uniref:23S rRNA (adenine(2030)-N(6))-methyltransferase RlmJ n=1 Tax=Zooshikella sp. RANM57 TaxID=3425863 RepID=UPI003D6F3784